MNSQTMMVLSMAPVKKEFPGPRAMQRVKSEWPTRDARMPRLSNVGIIHNFSALSSHAVISTDDSPCEVTSGTTIIDVMPDGALLWLVTSCARVHTHTQAQAQAEQLAPRVAELATAAAPSPRLSAHLVKLLLALLVPDLDLPIEGSSEEKGVLDPHRHQMARVARREGGLQRARLEGPLGNGARAIGRYQNPRDCLHNLHRMLMTGELNQRLELLVGELPRLDPRVITAREEVRAALRQAKDAANVALERLLETRVHIPCAHDTTAASARESERARERVGTACESSRGGLSRMATRWCGDSATAARRRLGAAQVARRIVAYLRVAPPEVVAAVPAKSHGAKTRMHSTGPPACTVFTQLRTEGSQAH